MSQPKARILITMLEPKASGSMVYWGYFDAVFEQKEYAESYVIEPLARIMLSEDEQLRKEFEAKKIAEPEFAKDQRAIINWFYNKSLWQDKQMNVYPVGRIMDRTALNGIKGN